MNLFRDKNKLSKEVIFYLSKNSFHKSPILNERPLKPKQVPFYSFANQNSKTKTQTYKDRLYVWGCAGTGALGID